MFKVYIFQCIFRILHLDREINVKGSKWLRQNKQSCGLYKQGNYNILSVDYTSKESTVFWILDMRKDSKNYWWKEIWKGQDAEESKEGLEQVMWQIGAAWVMWNVLEWQKVERNGVPWQPTFCEEDGTYSDSEWIFLKKHLGFMSCSIDQCQPYIYFL